MLVNHDIICMCEAWTNERSNITLEGYEHYAFYRKRKPRAKRDSGGLILYYRTDIAKGIKFLKNVDESVIWIELDKEFFKLEQTILIACCYVVPQGSSRNDILYINVFDELVMSIAQCQDADLVVNDNNEYLPLPDDYINDVTVNDRISKDIRAPTANGRQIHVNIVLSAYFMADMVTIGAWANLLFTLHKVRVL